MIAKATVLLREVLLKTSGFGKKLHELAEVGQGFHAESEVGG